MEPDNRRVIHLLGPLRREVRGYVGGWARVLSFVVPGLGHIFIGSVSFGVVYFTIFTATVVTILKECGTEEIIYMIGAGLIWGLSLSHIHLETRDT